MSIVESFHSSPATSAFRAGRAWAGPHENGRVLLAAMVLSRVTLGKVALAWGVGLWCAAIVLPNHDSHTRAHPAVGAVTAFVWGLLCIGTLIALVNYFNRGWRRAATVPNRIAYVIWMGLESLAGVGLFGLVVWTTVAWASAAYTGPGHAASHKTSDEFAMPAEFEPQEAVWISARPKESGKPVLDVVIEMVRALAPHVRIELMVPNEEIKAQVQERLR